MGGGGHEAGLLSAILGPARCHKVMRCDSDLDSTGGIVLYTGMMLYMFKALGTICDEYFVPAIEVIVERIQISPDVAGATLMAAGSSAPEFFTSLLATFVFQDAGGVGTIIGSAIFNILVIVGMTGFVACKDQALAIWWYPLLRDTVFYLLSIGELLIFIQDDKMEWWEGLLMLLTYICYCLYMKINPMVVDRLQDMKRGKVRDLECAAGEAPASPTKPSEEVTEPPPAENANADPPQSTAETGDGPLKPPALDNTVSKPGEETEKDEQEAKSCGCRDPLSVFLAYTMPSAERFPWTLFTLSILCIGIATFLMMDSTARIGQLLMVPPLVMGLIPLAAGTSIPDALASIAVAKNGEGDMAVANALGSNVFDILVGLGVPWMLKGIFSGEPVQLPSGSFEVLKWDVILLVGALVVFVGALALNRWRLTRPIGGVLIAAYFVFVIYQLLAVYAFKTKELGG